jgi:hypothetical protein
MGTSILETCDPWPDITSGQTWSFTADLAPFDRCGDRSFAWNAVHFLDRTYVTARLKQLACTVGRALWSNTGCGCVITLAAPPAAGKTHALKLLALMGNGSGDRWLAAAGVPELKGPEKAAVAIVDGENSHPQKGINIAPAVTAYTPWGELAYALGGPAAFTRMSRWDCERRCPPPEVLAELLFPAPAIVLLDRMAIVWRRFAQTIPNGAAEMETFTDGLATAIASSRRAAMVHTVARRSDAGRDPYGPEHARISQILEARQTDDFTNGVAPEGSLEIAAASRRFLFKRIADNTGTYPVDPAAFERLVATVNALGISHVFGGVLGVLGRTVHMLWKNRPDNLTAIRLEHLEIRPQVERLAYDYWELNQRSEFSEQLDWAAAKRTVQGITDLAAHVV